MARLYQHRTYGTYYTKRSHGAGMVTWQIHPDGVAVLKRQGIIIGGDIPSYALRVLTDRSWLFTREEAAQCREIDWAPAWETLGGTPVGRYPVWLARQKRDCTALLAASHRMVEGEQLAHHKEEAAARAMAAPQRPARATVRPSTTGTIAFPHPPERSPRIAALVESPHWLVVVLTTLAVIAVLAVAA